MQKYNLISVIQGTKTTVTVAGLIVLTCLVITLIAASDTNSLVSIDYAIAQQNATSDSEGELSSIPTMIEDVRDSVVGIILEEGLGPDYEYDGSGFVYTVEDDRVYVITSEHVVSDDENDVVDVHFIDSGKLFEANVTNTDYVADIAVLEIAIDSNQTIEPLILANSSEIRQGQQVFAIGSPFPTDTSIPNAVTSGIISKPLLTYEDGEGRKFAAVVSDDRTIGGNSGGPLLNRNGEVIGMVAAGDGDDLNCCSYAVPSNTIEQIVPVLIEDEEYSHPSIGLTPGTIGMNGSALSPGTNGVAILSIERGGPAHMEGLNGSTTDQFGEFQIGDIITAVDGMPITTADEFEAYIVQNKVVGDDVDLTIYRNGTVLHPIVTLESEDPA